MSEPFIISGDAGPLVRELERASQALRRFGGQEIPGPKVGGVTGGAAGNNLLGGLGGNIDKAYADLQQKVGVAQRNFYDTLNKTPAGGKAPLQTKAQFDRIGRDAISQINQAAAQAVERGVPIDVAKMFGTAGIKGVFDALGTQMGYLQQQAKSITSSKGPGTTATGLGGYGPKTIERNAADAQRSLQAMLNAAQVQHESGKTAAQSAAATYKQLGVGAAEAEHQIQQAALKGQSAEQTRNALLKEQLRLRRELATLRTPSVPGNTVLFRGEGPHTGPGYANRVDERTGRYFTDDLEKAQRYLPPGGRLLRVEATPAEVQQHGLHNPSDHVVLPDSMLQRAKAIDVEQLALRKGAVVDGLRNGILSEQLRLRRNISAEALDSTRLLTQEALAAKSTQLPIQGTPILPSERQRYPAGTPGGLGGRFAPTFGGTANPLQFPERPFDVNRAAGVAAPNVLANFLRDQNPNLAKAADALHAAEDIKHLSSQTTDSQRMLVNATRARVDSLQQETRLSGAYQAVQRYIPQTTLQAAYAAGGGSGGGGGRPPGPPPAGEGGGLFNSFLGGLSSRGLGQGQPGFHLEGLAASAGVTAKYAALSVAIYGVMNAVHEGAKEFLDYRDSLTDVATALSATQDQFESLRGFSGPGGIIQGGGLVSSGFEGQLQDYSRLAGTNVGAQLDAAARGIRAFGQVVGENRDSGDILLDIGDKTAEAVTQLAVITKTDYRDQTGNIIAIAQAYGLAADELSRVVDAVANSRNLGGDLAQVSQGLANFATVANEAGINPQEAANLISAIQAKTDQSGTLIATRLTRISQIANSAGGQSYLKGLGVDTDQGLLQQLSQLGKKFENGTLTPGQQKAAVSRLAGTANAREFTTALREMDDILEQSNPKFAKAGYGAQLFNNILSDFSGTLRKVRGDIKNITVELANSGIFDTLIIGVKLVEPALKAVADLLGEINEIGGKTGRIFRTTTFGVAEIAIAIALLKKFRDARAAAAASSLAPAGPTRSLATQALGAAAPVRASGPPVPVAPTRGSYFPVVPVAPVPRVPPIPVVQFGGQAKAAQAALLSQQAVAATAARRAAVLNKVAAAAPIPVVVPVPAPTPPPLSPRVANASKLVAASEAEAEGLAVATEATLANTAAMRRASLVEVERIQTLTLITEANIRKAVAEKAAAVTAEAAAAADGALAVARGRLGDLTAEASIAQAILTQRETEYTAVKEAQIAVLEANAAAAKTAATAQASLNLSNFSLGGFLFGKPGDPARRAGSRFNDRLDRRFPANAEGVTAREERGLRPSFGGVLGAVVGLTLLDQVLGNLADAGKRATEANASTATSLQKLGDVSLATPEGLKGTAENLRGAASKQREADKGFFAGIKNLFGAPDRSAFADNLDDLAKQVEKEGESLQKEQKRAARQGSASVFQDVQSVEGLTAGLDALAAVGTSATETINLLTDALGGLSTTDKKQGTILPGTLPEIKTELLSKYVRDLRKTYVNAFAEGTSGFRQQANDLDSPRLQKLRQQGNGFLPFGNPLDDTLLERLGPPSKTFSTKTVLNGKISRQQAGIEKAYEALQADGGKGLKEARDAAKKTIDKFFKRADIGDQGGVLTQQQQEELAHRIANAYTPKGLSGEDLKAQRSALYRRARAFIKTRLDPGNLIVDQETSSFVQKTLVENAEKQSQQRGVGDADAVRRSRLRQASLKKQIADFDTGPGLAPNGAQSAPDLDPAGHRAGLEAALLKSQENELKALNSSGKSPVELARLKLQAILDAEKTAIARHTKVDTSTIQAELEARRGLADALEDEAQANAIYQESLLGAQDEIGRARADIIETLRQAGVASANNDDAGAARLRAQANDKNAALPGLVAARVAAAQAAAINPGDELGAAQAALDATRGQIQTVTVRGQDGEFTKSYLDLIAQMKANAQALIAASGARNAAQQVAELDPRDQLGAAQAALDATRGQLEAVTVRGEDGQFTKAYLDLIAQLKGNAVSLIEARATAANAERDAFTNPASSTDQAASAIVDAQTLLNTAKKGTAQYYQYLQQLNQAKLAYAQNEQDSIEASILLRAGPDRLSKARAALAVANSRLKFDKRAAKGDYDTSGNLTGQAPDFEKIGEGIGTQFANGVTSTDWEQFGAEEVAGTLNDGISNFDWVGLGQNVANQFSVGILGVVDTVVSALAQSDSLAAAQAAGSTSPNAVDHRTSVAPVTYGGGVSSINTKEGQRVAPGAVAISQQYGNKSSRYASGVHTGVDIAAPYGSPVKAATGGKVVSAGYGGAYGNTIVIKADDGSLQRYGHLSQILTKVGDRISAGTQIGKVGSTGNSTGNHLHYEVTIKGVTVDPEKYLEGLVIVPTGKGGKGGKGSSGKASGSGGKRVTDPKIIQDEQAQKDAEEQVRLEEIALAKAVIQSKANPASSLSQARARLKQAALDLTAYAKGTTEYYEALAAYKEAQFAVAQSLAATRAARRAASVFPGDAVRAANVHIKNAADALRLTVKGTQEFYEALADMKSAQAELTAAIVDRNRTRFLLNHDFTNPLVQARADTRAAQQQLERDRKAGAPIRVIQKDKLAVEQAQAAEERTAFDQRLQAIQTAERLGRTSHAAYITYLNNEKHRLEAIAHRNYDQQQELDQIDGLLKDAADATAGQFNIGDINLPTPYEVRRYIKATTAGQQYQAGQQPGFGFTAAATQAPSTTTIQIDGADTGFILRVLSTYLGSSQLSRTSTSTRKA